MRIRSRQFTHWRNEDARLRDTLSNLSLQEAGGAQVAAGQAANREATATANMHSSIASGIGAVGDILPLYGGLGGKIGGESFGGIDSVNPNSQSITPQPQRNLIMGNEADADTYFS